jgi:hypothetical protein
MPTNIPPEPAPLTFMATVLMDEKSLAARWSISLKTLRNWRVTGDGPAFMKIGRCVRYAEADIEAFETSTRRHSTSAGGGDGY